ncbi:MAG: flagellin [Sporomusaceae bacterium]|jgi:flagellin|nr:flagellin [Sporomusaceae bacterium]
MIINHNVPAMDTNRNLSMNTNSVTRSLEKLSSGLRINKAADDAAGLAISEKMRGQIRGLDMAAKNGQDGVSLIQTAEGGMQTIENMLQRMRELAVQSSNDTNTSADRVQIQTEVAALISEVDRISTQSEFNTMKLLNGSYAGKHFHIGSNSNQSVSVNIDAMMAASLGIAATSIDLLSQGGANKAISTIQLAIDSVSSARAKLGAIQNRLEYSIEYLEVASVNASAAESRIRDVNMAKEMMGFTKNNILVQSATAMLAQANQQPQSVLSLLR